MPCLLTMAVELRLRLEHYLETSLKNSLLCGKITEQAPQSQPLNSKIIHFNDIGNVIALLPERSKL